MVVNIVCHGVSCKCRLWEEKGVVCVWFDGRIGSGLGEVICKVFSMGLLESVIGNGGDSSMSSSRVKM